MSRKLRHIKGQKISRRKTERKELNSVIKVKIMTLRREDYTQREIQQKINVNRVTINDIYKRTMNQFIKF